MTNAHDLLNDFNAKYRTPEKVAAERLNNELYELDFNTDTHDFNVEYSENTGMDVDREIGGATIQEIVEEVTYDLNYLLDNVTTEFKLAKISFESDNIGYIEIAGELDDAYADATIYIHPA